MEVIAPGDEGQVGEPSLDGIAVRRVRYAEAKHEILAYRGTMAEATRSPAGWLALIGMYRALRHAARESLARGADLVHAHWWVPGGLASPSEARLVLTVHGTDVRLLGRSGLLRALARPVFDRARVVTAVSTAHAAQVEASLGRTISAEHIQPMPADLAAFDMPGRGGSGAVVVARLTPQKRIGLALEAIAELAARGRRVRLTIVGDGPERGVLQAMAVRLGLNGLVQFAGMLPSREVAAVLQRADLMLFPARNEGFGLAAAEAMIAGVPVVACTDGGGVLDVVPLQGAGRRAAPQPARIAVAALDLLDDPSARTAARELGCLWRARLDPAAVAERCESWYREAMRA